MGDATISNGFGFVRCSTKKNSQNSLSNLAASLRHALYIRQLELTVPWEDRLQYSNALKADKYADLSMDLQAKGYRLDLFPIEVGARGVVGRSTYAFLTKIGLSSRERKKAMTRMSEAAEAASFWIWHMRSQKKS